MFIIMRLHRVTPAGKREPERTQRRRGGDDRKHQEKSNGRSKNTDEDHNL